MQLKSARFVHHACCGACRSYQITPEQKGILSDTRCQIRILHLTCAAIVEQEAALSENALGLLMRWVAQCAQPNYLESSCQANDRAEGLRRVPA